MPSTSWRMANSPSAPSLAVPVATRQRVDISEVEPAIRDNHFALAALAAKGAEIVEADLGKPETLAAAVKGAYGVSSLTDCA